jgi:hypothetical protein
MVAKRSDLALLSSLSPDSSDLVAPDSKLESSDWPSE